MSLSVNSGSEEVRRLVLPYDDGVIEDGSVRVEASRSGDLSVIRLTLMTSPPSIGIFAAGILIESSLAQQRSGSRTPEGNLWPVLEGRHRGLPLSQIWLMALNGEPATDHLCDALELAHDAIRMVARAMPLHTPDYSSYKRDPLAPHG